MKAHRLASTKVIQVIRTDVCEGSGLSPDDTCRIVTYYHALDGTLLAVNDPQPLPEPPSEQAAEEKCNR